MAKKTVAEKKAKIRQRGENAIKRGNQYRAKRLRSRYDKIDTNPVSFSSKKVSYTNSSSYEKNNSTKFANKGMPNLTYEDKFGTYDNVSNTTFKNPEKIVSEVSVIKNSIGLANTTNPLSGFKHTETVKKPGDYVSKMISGNEAKKIDLLEKKYYSGKKRKELKFIEKQKENNVIGSWSKFDNLRKMTSPQNIKTGSTRTFRIE